MIVEEKETLLWDIGRLWCVGGRHVDRGIRQGSSALLVLVWIGIEC